MNKIILRDEYLQTLKEFKDKNIKELKQVMDDEGMDISGMSDEEIEEQLEVFKLDDGHGYFFVEA